MKRIKRIFTLLALLAVFTGGFFFVSYRADNSTGKATQAQTVVIEKGDSIDDIAGKLKDKELISNRAYFIYYVWINNFEKQILAGEYEIGPKLKIPEIAQMLIKGETKPAHISVLFKEGWTAEEMAQQLNSKNLPGDEFLKISMNPPVEITGKFEFFSDIPAGSSLEGYLFPDTYFFSPEESAQSIVLKMLKNFDTRFSPSIRTQIKDQGKTVFEMMTMASIIEAEVATEKDRGIVSGIFWNRLGIDMALQSDATVSYALGGEKKIQHDANDISISSPYNTYRFKGLPPGPVSNPGLASIRAAINPVETDYLYFLNNPKTGETFFSVTFEEHVSKKAANGL
ncbi:MAG TPA: endolytic transglycosylase MltG [Candidatus Moranbacteria bacterium]|nr:MAG: Aminodeoxychorismate lyase [Candidatus Moranbacteria bacterium GW2011_GWC2_45_10]KKT93000.1 MAG: hypothetical protein UW95_C0027G0006 [Parcubacteria group bacterium GW2011_GWC1_45_14]HAV11345.1 endolytic transglycosylase MltG [Candidatus Moranbacteria bacterium]